MGCTPKNTISLCLCVGGIGFLNASPILKQHMEYECIRHVGSLVLYPLKYKLSMSRDICFYMEIIQASCLLLRPLHLELAQSQQGRCFTGYSISSWATIFF